MPIQPIKPTPLTKVKEKVDVSTVALILISAFSVGTLLGLTALTVSFNYLQGGGFFRLATTTISGDSRQPTNGTCPSVIETNVNGNIQILPGAYSNLCDGPDSCDSCCDTEERCDTNSGSCLSCPSGSHWYGGSRRSLICCRVGVSDANCLIGGDNQRPPNQQYTPPPSCQSSWCSIGFEWDPGLGFCVRINIIDIDLNSGSSPSSEPSPDLE